MNYSQTKYSHIQDLRSQSEKLYQHQVVENIVENNLKSLKISMTPLKKIKYQAHQRKKVELSDGWYCYITDNGLNRKHTILTLHGAPGDHVQWAGLQKQTEGAYRWINLTIPGFDGEDERRGSYNGTCDHFFQLILKLLDHLEIKKILLCSHSLGAILSSYFITKYPQVIQGYINITGIVDHWYVGLMTFFQTVIGQHGYNCQEWRNKNLLDEDKHRGVMYNLFLQTADDRSFGNIQFPKLRQSQYFSIVKLFNSTPHGLSQFYNFNRNLNLMRVLIFGKDDPLHSWPLVQASIFNLCRSQTSHIHRPAFKKLLEMAKDKIENTLKARFDVDVDANRLQQYFCYHFQETGHNAHKRRPKQIGRIMAIYTTCLDVMAQYDPLTQSKL